MRIIGIDPGLTRCGVGVVRIQGATLEFEHVEVLQSPPEQELPERLALLGDSLDRVISGGDFQELALERVFAQQNLPSVMGVAHISGIVMYLAAKAKLPVTLYSPNEIKSGVTGYGAADKTQVTNMVMRHLGLKQPPKPADAADALALAITHAFHVRARATTNPSSNPRSNLTPAQRAWKQAEQRAKRIGRG